MHTAVLESPACCSCVGSAGSSAGFVVVGVVTSGGRLPLRSFGGCHIFCAIGSPGLCEPIFDALETRRLAEAPVRRRWWPVPVAAVQEHQLRLEGYRREEPLASSLVVCDSSGSALPLASRSPGKVEVDLAL